MENRNPFESERGPSGPSSLSSPSGRGPVLTQDVRRATRDEGPMYETRRSDLKSEVRKYADRLYAEIKALYASFGVINAAELYAQAKAGKIKVKKEDGIKLLRLQTDLEAVLTRDELPEGYIEKLPPFEVFKQVIERINEKIAPRKITGLARWEEYELINGELNGHVNIGERWLPVIDGELIEKIDGKEIFMCGDIHKVRGKLNGWVRESGSSGLPLIEGKFINEIGGHIIRSCGDARNIDGKLNGRVATSARSLPVINGELIEEVEGMEIRFCSDVRIVGGKLNGSFFLENIGVSLPVINGVPIKEIGGKMIEDCDEVRNVRGKLNGKVKVDDGVWLPVIAGVLITEVGGKRIDWCGNVRNIGGKLNCVIRSDVTTLPVMDGVLVEEVDGRKIEKFSAMRNIDGELYGLLKVGEYEFPVIAGKVVDFNEGLLMVGIDHDDRDEFSDAGGRFTGKAIYRNLNGDKIKKTVVLGEFID